jgi:hypothetical protein
MRLSAAAGPADNTDSKIIDSKAMTIASARQVPVRFDSGPHIPGASPKISSSRLAPGKGRASVAAAL